MGLYLLKRLLLAIPSLWALATAVFLLSRLLPGTFGSERVLQSSGGYYSKGTEADRQAAYQEYVRRTGQDLPLFYITIAPAAQPSAAQQNLYPAHTQEQLVKLSWRYGSAHNAQAYIQSVTALERALHAYPDAAVGKKLLALQSIDDLAPLQEAAKEAVATASQPQLKRAAMEVLSSLQTMQRQQQANAYLLPEAFWHGGRNQYQQWLLRALQGDLGESFRSSLPVTAVLLEAIGNTWWLLVCSMLLTFVLALELSVLMAQKKGYRLRKALLPFLFITDSIPPFVLALLLLMLLANPDFLQLFPVLGMGYYTPQQVSLWQELAQWVYYMALPMLSLVLFNLPYITSQIYSSIHTALQADYVRTAKAKGLAEAAVIRKHAVRNSLLPIITIVSDFIPALVAGIFIVEVIFAVPGIGRLLVDSVLSRDYPVLTGIVLVIAAFRIAAYLLADIAYAWADPRIRQRML